MLQKWHDLLFAHWPFDPKALRSRVPARLPLDTFEGQAWLGVVPFRMSGVRLRATPAIPGLSAFPELNVRTYVTLEDKPGVFFFSLDAANALAVATARLVYHLPYMRAQMRCLQEGEAIRYASRRTHPGMPPAELQGRYGPSGPSAPAPRGSLAYWLTERYCLYAVDRRGGIHRGEILHERWPLQPAQAAFDRNTMATPLGLELRGDPLLHFARYLKVQIWPLQRVLSS